MTTTGIRPVLPQPKLIDNTVNVQVPSSHHAIKPQSTVEEAEEDEEEEEVVDDDYEYDDYDEEEYDYDENNEKDTESVNGEHTKQ